MKVYKVLSIGGFDSSGGAGIQADLKTFSAFGCYGMTVLTALPVQNTCGVRTCHAVGQQVVAEQLDAIFSDITPDAIKIGMLFQSDIIKLVAAFLNNRAKDIPVVLDPVMAAKSGDLLLMQDAIEDLKSELLGIATILTPNLPEAKVLTGLEASAHDQMPDIAERLIALGCSSVLLKGGHLKGAANSNDFYLDHQGNRAWLKSERIKTKNTHGTGCTLSAAIAACLTHKMPLLKACKISKHYMQNALRFSAKQHIGKGRGPVHHFYHIWPTINNLLEKQTSQKQ